MRFCQRMLVPNVLIGDPTTYRIGEDDVRRMQKIPLLSRETVRQ